MKNNTSSTLLIIIIVIILFFIIFEYTQRVRKFLIRKRYFKMELERATSTERYFWRKKLLKEYLSIIPFVGIIFAKKKKRK